MKELLTYRDIAKLTGISVETLMVWRHRGKLPPPDLAPNQRTALWEPETIEAWNKERLDADR
jgi:predicted site-specific integrase-resolvase